MARIRFLEQAVWVLGAATPLICSLLASKHVALAAAVGALFSSSSFSVARFALARVLMAPTGRARLVYGLVYLGKFLVLATALAVLIVRDLLPSTGLALGMANLPVALMVLLVVEGVKQCRTG